MTAIHSSAAEELYARKLNEAREEAAYNERMKAVIRLGRIDRSEGRVIVGTQNLFAAVESIRNSRFAGLFAPRRQSA